MQVDRKIAGWVACGVLTMAVGCSGPTAPVKSAKPATSGPPAYSGPIITATDKEELLKGAGIVDADAPKEFTATGSGLKYRILRKSDGKKPTANSIVKVNYRGWLDDGKEFDSSYKRGEPTGFPLQRVIPGWTEGLQLVGEGGMIELWIPSDLAYGERGSPGGVPPNATLHFIVELLEVR